MKKVLPRCLVFLSLVLFAMPLKAQEKEKEGAELLRADAEGKHFIVGFMQNEENRSLCALAGDRAPAVQQIHITSRAANTVTITYPNGESQSLQLFPLEVKIIDLNGEEYECLGEGICDKSIEVVSENPISLYCFSSKPQTTDGYLALPISSWGTEYVTANYPMDYYTANPLADPNNCNTEPRRGEFAVIAAEDNTIVTVIPATATASGEAAGVPIVRTLQKGEIWQVQSGGRERGGHDLTGSSVTADKPVGVLSGHERAAIPWEHETKNHLIEMLPPVNNLGTRHIVVPFGGREGGDRVRVIGTQDGATEIAVHTALEEQGHTSIRTKDYTIQGVGKFVEISLTDVSVIETNQPVLVAQYSQSNGVDLSSNFDPYLVIVMPEEQFAYSSLFQTMPDGDVNRQTGKRQFDQHFLTIAVKYEKWWTMHLNNEPFPDHPLLIEVRTNHVDSAYLLVTFRLPGGTAFNITGGGLFGGYVYGIGEFDSYGWPIGASGELPNGLIDSIPPQFSATAGCGGEFYEVVITESREEDEGIFAHRLDSARSFNVRLLSPPGTEVLTRRREVTVGLIDPQQPGMAVIIAQDHVGNLDTLVLALQVRFPVLSREAVSLSALPVNTAIAEVVGISNPNDQPLLLDSAWLMSGQVVTIDGLGMGGVIGFTLDSGESYDLALMVRAPAAGTYLDTLVLIVDCRSYFVPVSVEAVEETSMRIADLNFGQVLIEDKICRDFPIMNAGAVPITITGIWVEGPFRIDPFSMPSLPVVLKPGERLMLSICYTPPDMKEHIGTIWVTTGAGTTSAVLRGIGTDNASSVDDAVDRDGGGITVIRQGNALLLESNGAALQLRNIRLVALNGETLLLGEGRAEGANRRRVSLPEALPSGVYYFRAERRDGAPVTARVLIVR